MQPPSRKIEALWAALGARTARMTAAHHDRVIAIVSHLPHLIAFTICGTADDLADETREEVLQFAASRFPRLHAHRRLRPGDVARHFYQ